MPATLGGLLGTLQRGIGTMSRTKQPKSAQQPEEQERQQEQQELGDEEAATAGAAAAAPLPNAGGAAEAGAAGVGGKRGKRGVALPRLRSSTLSSLVSSLGAKKEVRLGVCWRTCLGVPHAAYRPVA